MSKSYRLKCRNEACGHEFHRYWTPEEFDKLQYGAQPGIGCFSCGYPKMIVIKSNRNVNDKFKPGWQPNIRKHCATYSEYKAWLDKMGLIEVGNDDIPENKYQAQQYFDEKMIKKIVQSQDPSDQLTGNEINYLLNMHKDKEHLAQTKENIKQEINRKYTPLSDEEKASMNLAADNLLD